jgi:gamma-glutamyltranspeptidase/glutathione hydrolase
MMANKGMVVAAQPEAAEAGLEALRAGGNAVDAALACAFVQTAIDPLMCGIAGFGSMAVYMPNSSTHEYVDFHAPAPLRATPTMWQDIIEGETRDGFGFVLKDRVNDLGYQAVCAPAALKAFELASRRYGKLPWKDLLASAIDYAERGWMVRPAVSLFWNDEGELGRVANYRRLGFSPTGRKLYFNGERPKRTGETIRNPDYAATLQAIAEHGSDIFYRGAIADRIVADMKEHGGLLGREDLEKVPVKITKPLTARYRGYDVTTNPPPGGGIMVLQMLSMLEQFDLAELGHNTASYLCTLSEVMKRATIDKDRFVGDPSFVDIPIERLLSADYAAELVRDIRNGVRAHVPRIDNATPVPNDTTQVCAVDADGNCVSMTHSLGAPSGVITDGLGFMFNGCMGVFDPRPGRPGSIAPGKARFSAMCPSIVLKDGKLRYALGAPGGTQIAMGVLQVILNLIDHKMNMLEAITAPRFSSTSDAIDVVNRIPRYVTREAESRGYRVVRNPYGYSVSWVHGIALDGDQLSGAADPGRDGVAYSM